jgi:hypothetical protein
MDGRVDGWMDVWMSGVLKKESNLAGVFGVERDGVEFAAAAAAAAAQSHHYSFCRLPFAVCGFLAPHRDVWVSCFCLGATACLLVISNAFFFFPSWFLVLCIAIGFVLLLSMVVLTNSILPATVYRWPCPVLSTTYEAVYIPTAVLSCACKYHLPTTFYPIDYHEIGRHGVRWDCSDV